jgi:hypothetical protein
LGPSRQAGRGGSLRPFASLIGTRRHLHTDMMTPELLHSLQARAARIAIGPSSMRGPGSEGVVRAARLYLQHVALSGFGTANAKLFRTALDRTTDELMRALPKASRHWGLARKGLNIFLRDCLYTIYLRDAFWLGASEEFFEVPLDSISGKALYEHAAGKLPRWQTVRGMTPTLSDKYQAEASRVAKLKAIPRVHLDAIWWGERPPSDTQ